MTRLDLERINLTVFSSQGSLYIKKCDSCPGVAEIGTREMSSRLHQTYLSLFPKISITRTQPSTGFHALTASKRVQVKPLASATCSNSLSAFNSRRPDSAATMSTVAIPASQYPQPHHLPPLHQHDSESLSDDSETPRSSRASSPSRRRQGWTTPKREENLPVAPQRMSFFTLGYKEAAYQWVCPPLLKIVLYIYTFKLLWN